MAQPNFYLTNKYFALSPMVLHATMEAGAAVTLTVTVNRTRETVKIGLQADTQGKVVYDMAPLVRDLIRKQFRRENIKANDFSPYGIAIRTQLDNTYYLEHSVVWAAKDKGLLQKSYNYDNPLGSVWLLPQAKFVYNHNAPNILLTTFSREENDTTIYAKNKKSGKVTDVGDLVFYIPYNIKASYFEELENGEYEVYYGPRKNGVVFDLTVTDDCFPTDALKEGKMVYVRYCNQWGGLSYSLLQATERKKKNKNTYVSKEYALDGDPDTETIYTSYPDRVMTGQEITTTFKAGKDKLTLEELRELEAILLSPMVDRYDAETDEWVPVYPSDNSVTETNDALHEITIEFEENTEGF